jgi:hypothetical protein
MGEVSQTTCGRSGTGRHRLPAVMGMCLPVYLAINTTTSSCVSVAFISRHQCHRNWKELYLQLGTWVGAVVGRVSQGAILLGAAQFQVEETAMPTEVNKNSRYTNLIMVAGHSVYATFEACCCW